MSKIFAQRISTDLAIPINDVNDLFYYGLKVTIGIKYPGNPGNIVHVENIGDKNFYQAVFTHEENMATLHLENNSSLKALFLKDEDTGDIVSIMSI